MQKLWQNPIFLIIGGIILLGAIVWGLVLALDETGPTVAPSNGSITAQQSTHDFGTISMQGGKVEHSYELRNESAEPVTLGELYTSCMCTEAQAIYPDESRSKTAGMKGHGLPAVLNQTIQSGETFQVRVIFDPTAHGPAGTGPAHRVVYLETNSKNTPVLELRFDVNVTP